MSYKLRTTMDELQNQDNDFLNGGRLWTAEESITFFA